MTPTLPIGTMLYGYCRGYFGRDSLGAKRVEAVGADWVVARNEHGGAEFATGSEVHRDLAEHTDKTKELE